MGGVESKITCEKLAFDKADRFASISSELMPVGAVIEEDHGEQCAENRIRTVSLDGYFKGKKVTTIKADIEGKEADMLLGAQKTIKQWKPLLAISIYHKPSDLFRIYEWIDALGQGYRFAVRCHIADGNDTVLYAY